jgi:hypothetical protein
MDRIAGDNRGGGGGGGAGGWDGEAGRLGDGVV